MTIPADTRRAINEAEVRRYFSACDPSWRWVLILGFRDMRANLDRIGRLAADAVDEESWAADSYAYGPLALGITAAAVNEAVEHCEDLFALLMFLRDPQFARRIGAYEAGRVRATIGQLSRESDSVLARRFCVPPEGLLESGLADAEDPVLALEAARSGISRLGALVREVVDFYKTYEFFHVQYKHGLKVALRPFGAAPPTDTIAKRKSDVSAPLFALSNEVLSKTLSRPPGQQALIIPADPLTQPYLAELIAGRDILRIQLAGPEINLDDVVAHSWTVSRLLRMASANRLSLGQLDKDGQQSFQLPAEGAREVLTVRIAPRRPVVLSDVTT